MNARDAWSARVRIGRDRRGRDAGTEPPDGVWGAVAELESATDRLRQPTLVLSREDVMLLLASLHEELARIRSTRSDSPDVVEHAETSLGQLIWRLEEFDAWPLPAGHSADAVQP